MEKIKSFDRLDRLDTTSYLVPYIGKEYRVSVSAVKSVKWRVHGE